MKTITKRAFCHNVTTHLKNGEDLLITGRNFEAILKFIKGGYKYKEKALGKDDLIPCVKKAIKTGKDSFHAKGTRMDHALNCPCVMCKPPKKK